ncbi:MAG: HlyD family type I secretion periplasmic adaptor subunit [Marinovum algicola]
MDGLVARIDNWLLALGSAVDGLVRRAAFVEAAVWLGLGAVVIAALVVVALRRWRAARRGAAPLTVLGDRTRWPRRLGYATIAVFFGGFGLWSAGAPLASAALAPGVVNPEGSRKTIQHLEGGIIRAIHVGEGDAVEAGQPLVTLEDVQARAALEEVRERYVHLVAHEARLVAEQAGAAFVEIPAELNRAGPAGRQALHAQIDLFASRRETLRGRHRILDQRVAQLERQIAGLERVIAAEDRQLALLGQEIATVEALVADGLAKMPRLLALQRSQAEVMASQGNNEATIARHRERIGETEYQALTLEAQRREEIDAELARVRAELATVRSQLPSRRDLLARTTVAAPIAGTVMNVQVTTESGVIGPGEPVLEIVPREARLIVDARVAPTDIETVRPGQRARVLLTAYGQRNLPQIFGTLRSVSADRLVDERDGRAYFLARVAVDPAELEALGADLELVAGMPADVMILTGERTLLDYLLRPLADSLTRSFKEV